MLAQDPHYALAAVPMAVANSEAAVDMDADVNMGVEDDTSRTHQNAPIAVWTTTQLKNAGTQTDWQLYGREQ